ncbi:MAG: pitrilysin family protein [Kofleriaceae bacterium]
MTGPRGSQLFVEPSPDTPLVWFDVALLGGAAADPVGVEGLHRHAAVLARRGAGARDRAAFDESLDAMGAAVDVAAGRDAITVSGVCLRRHLDAVVDLVADLLARPRFDLAEHERLLRETPQVLDEIRDDDSALASRWFDWECAPGHPYGRTALGTRASLSRITRDDAIAVWQREVVPANLVIGLAGDVDPDAGAALAARMVEGLSAQPAPPLPVVPETAPVAGRRLVLVDKPDRTQAQLRLGHLGPRFGGDDTPALLLAETAFGGMFSSRLMQEIRVKRGWSYGAGCGLRRSRGSHWFEAWMATEVGVAGDAVALTLGLLEELAVAGITAEELELARSYLVGSLPFSTATARQRLHLLVRDAVYGLPPGYSIGLPARLEGLGVAEVTAACARHVRPEALVTVAVTTADTAHDALAAAGAGTVTVVAHDAY